MADIDENLVTVLAADAAVSAITTDIHVNNVPESIELPAIWIQLDDEFEETDLAGSGGAAIHTFDVECVSTDLDEAKDLQTAVKAELHGKSGAFGDQTIAFAEVSGKDDSFEPRNPFGDQKSLHVCALTIEIGTDGRS